MNRKGTIMPEYQDKSFLATISLLSAIEKAISISQAATVDPKEKVSVMRCIYTALDDRANVNCRIKVGAESKLFLVSEEDVDGFKLETRDLPRYERSSKPNKYRLPMRGTTTLLNYLATKNDLTEIAELIMERGADLGVIDYSRSWVSPNYERGAIENYFQNTPLLDAIASENIDFANVYMTFLEKLSPNRKKEILDYKDKFQDGFHTALEFSIRRGYMALACKILQEGANPNPTQFVHSHDASPLHMACMLLGTTWTGSRWCEDLGSGVELIISLLNSGADATKIAKTFIYQGRSGGMDSYTSEDRAPAVYLNIEIDTFKSQKFQEQIINCTQRPSYRPSKKGDIRHPFEEECSFLCKTASRYRSSHNREKYFSSAQFQKDKERLQAAFLMQAHQEYQNTNQQLHSISNINDLSVTELYNIGLDLNKEWFLERYKLYGLFPISQGVEQAIPVRRGIQPPVDTTEIKSIYNYPTDNQRVKDLLLYVVKDSVIYMLNNIDNITDLDPKILGKMLDHSGRSEVGRATDFISYLLDLNQFIASERLKCLTHGYSQKSQKLSDLHDSLLEYFQQLINGPETMEEICQDYLNKTELYCSIRRHAVTDKFRGFFGGNNTPNSRRNLDEFMKTNPLPGVEAEKFESQNLDIHS